MRIRLALEVKRLNHLIGIYDLLVVKLMRNVGTSRTRAFKKLPIDTLIKLYELVPNGIRNLVRTLLIFSINQIFIRGSLEGIKARVKHSEISLPDNPGLVSVVLPTYNHLKYLKQSIESVLSQTYKNIELIIVNDGSTDGTEDFLNIYKSNLAITVINQKNMGLPNALNVGFAVAKGEFLTWTSADNFYENVAIDQLVKYLEDNNGIGVVYGNYFAINQNGEKLSASDSWRSYDRNLENPAVVQLPKEAQFFKRIPVNSVGPLFLYRASLAKFIGKYSNTPGIEDYDFWSRMELVANFMRLPTNLALYSYRVHNESISAAIKSERQIFKTIAILVRISRKRALEKNTEILVGTLITESIYARYWNVK